MTRLAFGPLAYVLQGDVGELPTVLAPFATAPGPGRVVELARAVHGTTSPARVVVADEGRRVAGPGFSLVRAPDRDLAWVDGAVGLLSALGALASLDGPPRGLLLVHAAGLRVDDAVAVVLAPPGTGKSTLVRAAGGPRAFAYNAVLLTAGDAGGIYAWPAPFTGHDDPPLDRADGAPVGCLLEARREGGCTLEWCRGVDATLALARAAMAIAPDVDPCAAARGQLALDLAARVPFARLHLDGTDRYLVELGRTLRSGAFPVRGT